jgi:RNA polymerase sigma factor (sigma-70 family)
MPKQWTPTQESFDRLLAWFDADRERAGRKYEEIRQSLVRIFAWRGYGDAEDLADETINRVSRRVGEVAESYHGDPALYFYGVAKRLMLERARKEPAEPLTPEVELRHAARESHPAEDAERRDECLSECLRRLDPENRKLILLYYEKERQSKIDFRKELARARRTDINALRVKVHRIRGALLKCVQSCLESAGANESL